MAVAAFAYMSYGRCLPIGSAVVTLCVLQAASLVSSLATMPPPTKKVSEDSSIAWKDVAFAWCSGTRHVVLGVSARGAFFFCLALACVRALTMIGAISWHAVIMLACLAGALRRTFAESSSVPKAVFSCGKCSYSLCDGARCAYASSFWYDQDKYTEQNDGLTEGALDAVVKANESEDCIVCPLSEDAHLELTEGSCAEWQHLMAFDDE